MMLLFYSCYKPIPVSSATENDAQRMPNEESLTKAEIKQVGLCDQNGNPRYGQATLWSPMHAMSKVQES